MRNISIIMLVLALLLGTLTVIFTRNVIQNQRSAQPTTVAVGQAETELATVVVAVLPMKFGDELTAEKLKVASWPADIRPEGSFETITEILGADRRVVLRSIGKNEPITKEKISGFGSRASLSQVIEEGYRAAAIRINPASSVAGFILPGDRVDVLLTFRAPNSKEQITNIILQDVRVLAIDQLSDESQGGAIIGSTATMEVSPEHAQKLALASGVGSMSLVLRRLSPEDEIELINSKSIFIRDLIPSKGEAVVQPPKSTSKARRVYKPVAKVVPKKSPYGDMKVTRALNESTEKVLVEEVLKEKTTTDDPTKLGGTPSLQ